MKDVLIGIRLMFYATSALAVGTPDGTVIHDDQACYTIFSGAWGHGKKLGATWQTIAHAHRDGRNVLEIVVHQRVGKGDFDMRDHLVLDAATLLPIRLESMRDGKPHAELDYTSGRVTGWHVAKDGSRLTTDVRLPGPVWDGDLYGPTFAALKLAAGARFTVPFYQYDRGLGEFRATVTGIDRVMTPYGGGGGLGGARRSEFPRNAGLPDWTRHEARTRLSREGRLSDGGRRLHRARMTLTSLATGNLGSKAATRRFNSLT